MERTASIVVVDTVKTMSRVTISVGLAQEVVKMVSTEHIVTNVRYFYSHFKICLFTDSLKIDSH